MRRSLIYFLPPCFPKHVYFFLSVLNEKQDGSIIAKIKVKDLFRKY